MAIGKENYVHLESGKFARNEYSKDDLDHLFRTFREHENKDLLVVHFHGGIVSHSRGLEISDRLMNNWYEPAGAYPVFFLWESHPWETVKNNLGEIFKEVIFERLKKYVVQFALAKLEEHPEQRGQRLQLPSDAEVWEELELVAQKKIPYATIDPHRLPPTETLSDEQSLQFEEHLEQDYRLTGEVQKIVQGLTSLPISQDRGARIQGSTATLMSEDILANIRAVATPGRGSLMTARIIKGAVGVLIKVIKRFVQHRDHGFYPTIIEELLREFYVANAGKIVWDAMKKDTADSFICPSSGESQIYGGTAFLEELKKSWLNGHKPRIVLVGHSAGSIYICRWLEAAEKQNLPDEMKFDVLFLAPACTFDLFAGTLDNYGHRIAHIRAFGMKDELEQEDKVLGPFYPLSLLYLISGIFEKEADKPLIGMERYYSGSGPFCPNSNNNMKKVLEFLCTDPIRIYWSKVNRGPGKNSEAATHGDFDDDSTTLNSIKHILQSGF